jgi:putative IMPACT (imprinted ancient) family translation regulator
VEEAGIVRYSLCDDIRVMVDYSMFSPVKNLIDKQGFIIKNLEYGLDVEMTVQAGINQSDVLIGQVMDLTAGSAIIEKAGLSYSEEHDTKKYL